MSSPIVFGRGKLRDLASSFDFPAGRAFLVSSPAILELHGRRIREAIAGRERVEITIDDSEASKNLVTLQRILDAALAAGIRRDDFVVSFGGGVVSDVAGFAAAILLRGIEWYAVPTTLLAMADAAIGGKTAVDHSLGKNLIGAFHLPSGVLVDPELLETLSDRQFRSGMMEVYKAALIADAPAAGRMSGRLEEIAGRRNLEDFLETAIRVKREVVERDPRESGERRILNFGHTLGHAIEAAGRFEMLTHGEAIALGMATALILSVNLAGFPGAEAESLARELVSFAGADRAAGVDSSAPRLWEILARDKKFSARSRPAVLLSAIARPAIREATPGQWKGAFARVRSFAVL